MRPVQSRAGPGETRGVGSPSSSDGFQRERWGRGARDVALPYSRGAQLPGSSSRLTGSCANFPKLAGEESQPGPDRRAARAKGTPGDGSGWKRPPRRAFVPTPGPQWRRAPGILHPSRPDSSQVSTSRPAASPAPSGRGGGARRWVPGDRRSLHPRLPFLPAPRPPRRGTLPHLARLSSRRQ